MPKANEQHDPVVGGVPIPNFVLPRVVKDQELTFSVASHLFANTYTAAFGNDQRQVGSKPRVGRATVRMQVSAWAERREGALADASLRNVCGCE
eukprot:CAMPEP_0119388252 /NCGR_PEP_ID=MMETSP1334-20130426/104234_1 /TAXON_ID=127549 /ORGANISM="Calcidiscus leptoporus, Strain RCC1130" /LENGTH=93 /DNA_ID=CAMNT_0007410181 /DNA_START=250 /DNA_END=531 /DNA_ORIENTATION=-